MFGSPKCYYQEHVSVSSVRQLLRHSCCCAAGCRYFIDTDAAGAVQQYQQVTLEYRMDRTVATCDNPPFVLGQLPAGFVQQMDGKLKPGRLLRFSIREGGIQFHEGRPVGAALHYEGPANQRRGRCDLLSKILFQYSARRESLTIEQLMNVVQQGGVAVACDMAQGE